MKPNAVILVRHADPAAGGADPSLSPAGVHRAGVLAKMLADAGITAIFTSELRRTKETAKPLASLLNIVPVVIANDATAAANQIKAAGKRVLVVGHSNTVPEFIHALAGPANVVINPIEFDRLFVLEMPAHGADSLISIRYPG
jgi:broad specificity phosphatase PhoE